MTIANENNRDQHTATAGQTTFSYSFEVEANDEIVVYLTPAGSDPDDSSDILILTTNYSVTGVGDAGGGNIVLTSGATVNDVITIARDITVNQDNAYVIGQDHAEAIEASLDRITMRLQMIDEQVNRSLKTQLTDGSTYFLPKPEAGRLLGWNATENGLQNLSGSEPVDASVVAAAASAAAALVSENNAATSETNAAASETASAASATASAASATLSLSSAGDAAASAASATTSATAAATSASQASTSANNAATSETNAASSETSAAADAISTAADAISTAADAISTAADVSSTNADAISTAADVATTSQDAIDTAADATSTAADVVLTNNKYDEFDDRYLGVKTSDPALDNDGGALITGAIYFNSSTNVMRAYNGSSWGDIGTAQNSASSVNIADAGGYYTGGSVEAALQEIGLDQETSGLVLETSKSMIGLTQVNFTGVPSWVKKITVLIIDAGAASATTTIKIGIGDSGGVETSGYVGTGSRLEPSQAIVATVMGAAFDIAGGSTFTVTHGIQATVTIINITGNTWIVSATGHSSGSTAIGYISSGVKTLTGVLDRLRVQQTGGANLNSGEVNVLYEG